MPEKTERRDPARTMALLWRSPASPPAAASPASPPTPWSPPGSSWPTRRG
ncbi:hypothetical protein ACFQV2_15205 [Actinokineospora soli]|uniref:Uncharacterized protein n=1 Tax=Actinokineospora soli TaxID=1048753 RepID=A0ABW2TLQ6_9PSEU